MRKFDETDKKHIVNLSSKNENTHIRHLFEGNKSRARYAPFTGANTIFATPIE